MSLVNGATKYRSPEVLFDQGNKKAEPKPCLFCCYKDTQRKSALQKQFTKSIKTQRSRVHKGTETEEEYQKWYEEAKVMQRKAEAEKTEPDIFEKQLAEIDPHRKI